MLKIHYLRVSDYDAVTDAELAGKVCEETISATETFRCAKVRRLKCGVRKELLPSGGLILCLPDATPAPVGMFRGKLGNRALVLRMQCRNYG